MLAEYLTTAAINRPVSLAKSHKCILVFAFSWAGVILAASWSILSIRNQVYTAQTPHRPPLFRQQPAPFAAPLHTSIRSLISLVARRRRRHHAPLPDATGMLRFLGAENQFISLTVSFH
jgi:hypothetical protein